MPLTVRRIEVIRTLCYGALGLTFLATGLFTLLTGRIPPVPSPAYAAVGVLVAAVLFAVAFLAPPRAVEGAYDEGATQAWLRATSFGYWAGIVLFAALGNMASAGWIAVGPAFLATSMLAASAPFVHFLVGEWRRAR